VCLAILLAGAASIPLVAQLANAYLRKLPLPLKRPLHELDPARLAPDYVLRPLQPDPLPDTLLEQLGTREYLNWYLIDQTRPPWDPTRMVHVFITYHTGQPDLVPHNPRECLPASGWDLIDEHQIVVSVPHPNGDIAHIPLAVLEFAPPRGGNRRLTVLFFFYANGRYATTRTAVRLAVSNLSDRYAYYSKIELSFSDERERRLADREASEQAAKRLLRRLMPVLWEDHYPDWEAVRRGEIPATDSMDND